MGKPQRDPRRPETSTATRDKASEKKEVPKGQKEMTIEDLRRKQEEVCRDTNEPAALAICRVRGDIEPYEQREDLTKLYEASVSVLTKLAKAGVDISKLNETQEIKDAINAAKRKGKIELTVPEEAAVQRLDSIIRQKGPTATELEESWKDRIEAAQWASKSSGEKWMAYYDKHPVATTAITATSILFGGALLYLGYKQIKKLFGKDSSEKAEKGKQKTWFRKEVMIPIVLALLGAGGYLAKDEIYKIMKEAGLDPLGVKDKVEKGEDFTKDQQKKLKKAGRK